MRHSAHGPATSPSTPGSTQLYTQPFGREAPHLPRCALEGERKQVTVLFADMKGSMELLADREPRGGTPDP